MIFRISGLLFMILEISSITSGRLFSQRNLASLSNKKKKEEEEE